VTRRCVRLRQCLASTPRNRSVEKLHILALTEKRLPERGKEEFEKALVATRSSGYGGAALTAEVLAVRGHAQLSLGQEVPEAMWTAVAEVLAWAYGLSGKGPTPNR